MYAPLNSLLKEILMINHTSNPIPLQFKMLLKLSCPNIQFRHTRTADVIHMSFSCNSHVIRMPFTCHSHAVHMSFTCHSHACPFYRVRSPNSCIILHLRYRIKFWKSAQPKLLCLHLLDITLQDFNCLQLQKK